MRRIFVLAAVSAAAVLGSPGAAGAELVAPASELPVESAWPVAAGPGGRALAIVPGPFCEGCNEGRVAERAASGRWTLRAITPPGMFPVFVAWGPGATATALGVANVSAGTGGSEAFVLRRPPAAVGFGVPAQVALGGPIWDNWHVASDARGDVAFITAVRGPDSIVRTVLVTAAHGGSFGLPQELPLAHPQEAAIAVGGGRVVVAYSNRRGVYARTGVVGSPLGAPQLLTTRGFGELCTAIDDAGNATVAFGRGRTFDHALAVARARPGERFGAPAVLAHSRAEFGPIPQAAAAGATTALIWSAFSDEQDVGVHAAIARGAARFAPPDAASAPGLGPRGAHGQPWHPVVAVDRAGDVLVAYAYSFDGAVHATMRRAGSARFGALHVISRLGEGGWPSVALLSDRRPLVIYHGRHGELLASTHLTGPSPDLTPPRLTIKFTSHALDELRATNAVTVTVRASKPCILRTRASLHTRDGRTVADGVDRKILRRGVTFSERFAFDPDRRAGLARDGASVRVTVDAQNASGASNEAVKQIKL